MEQSGIEWNRVEWIRIVQNGIEWNRVEQNRIKWNEIEWNKLHHKLTNYVFANYLQNYIIL